MSAVEHLAAASDPGVRRLAILYRLVAALSEATSLENVYDVALTNLLDATAANSAAILLFDEDGTIRSKASRGLSSEYRAAVTGHCPWRQGALRARPVLVPDTALDKDLLIYRDFFDREEIRALVFLPLALNTGVFGELVLYYRESHEFKQDEIEIAQAIAGHVSLATQQKRAEIARNRSERQLQAILDNSAAVIFVKDVQGKYQLINRLYEELFHVTKARVLGRTDYDIFPKEVADQFQANDRAVLDAGKPLAIEECAPQDDGVHTYISLKFPLEGSDDTVTGVCGIATDITERKKFESASQRLAAIVESSDDAIVSKDLNGIITSWNKGAERIFGYTAAEAVGQPVAMLAAPDRLDEMPRILSKIRQGQPINHYETRRRRKDGQIIDIALTVSPVRDTSGQIIGASKIARDITERKRAEQERAVLLTREQEARRTAELLNQVGHKLSAQLDLEKLVQEITDIATALVGADFGSFFHNATNEKGESWKRYAVSGERSDTSADLPIPRNTDLWGTIFRGPAILRFHDVSQDSAYSKNPPHYSMPEGQLPIRSYLAAPVLSRSGEVLGGLYFGHSLPGKFTEAHESILKGIAAQAAIAIDNARLFEERERVEADLKRSNEELRLANRDLEFFAYSASHDLQEPLRTIMISAQLLERQGGQQLAGDDAVCLANILGGANRMRVLIQDLLTYMKAAKSEPSATSNVDAGRVLADVLVALRAQIGETGAQVTSTELPTVAIHQNRLAQLFQNLISNAIKYCSKKEVPRIHVSAEERHGWWVFSVVDNGIGIEPKFAEEVFGLFKRLHDRREYSGSGLGLAICQRIVEQYGGRIWVEQSTPGTGSTFCFSLPRENENRTPIEEQNISARHTVSG